MAIHALHRTLSKPRPWRRLLHRESQAEIYDVTTDDGQDLVLRRIVPRASNAYPPVLMLHGLAANHLTWRFPERSLADWLAERGHDVWLAELRGHGDSVRKRFDWRFDDYLNHDIPTIIETIQAVTESDEIQWIGHSMGGVLLYFYGILHPEPPLAAGIAVASGLDYKVGASGFKPMLALRPLLEPLVAVPYGTLVHLLSPALGRGLPIEGFNVVRSNIEPEVVRRIHARCFHTIPVSLLQSLSTTFEDDGFKMQDGFVFEHNVGRYKVPSLLLAGSGDMQVSVEAVEHTSRLLRSSEIQSFGREYGHADDYGHFDLILGKRAQTEVWPTIADFLESH